MYKNGKSFLTIGIISILVFSVFGTFTYALAVDNNCPVNVIHILQVTPALLCLESRIDVLENTPVSAGSGEANTASNLGSIGEGWFDSKVGVDLQFKKAVAGTGITLQSNGTRVMINSTSGGGETTTCTNAGHESLVKSSSGGNCVFYGLTNGTGILIPHNSTDNEIKTRFANGTGISITGTGIQTFTNTGVISNSCSNGISCSGTNPSTFTVKMELLCQQTLGSTNSTIICNISARKHLFFTAEIRSTGGTGIEPMMLFNGDSGTNYTHRVSTNGGADATGTNISRCNQISVTTLIASGGGGIIENWIYNNQSGDRKLSTGHAIYGIDTADTTAPNRYELGCKWDNTTTQITKITLGIQSGTGSYNTGSILTVWGYD